MKKFTAMTLAAAMLATTAFGMNVSAATKLNLSVPDAASSSIGVAAQTRSFRMTTNNIRPITQPSDFEGIKLL